MKSQGKGLEGGGEREEGKEGGMGGEGEGSCKPCVVCNAHGYESSRNTPTKRRQQPQQEVLMEAYLIKEENASIITPKST